MEERTNQMKERANKLVREKILERLNEGKVNKEKDQMKDRSTMGKNKYRID